MAKLPLAPPISILSMTRARSISISRSHRHEDRQAARCAVGEPQSGLPLPKKPRIWRRSRGRAKHHIQRRGGAALGRRDLSNLVDLATRFVSLSRELDVTRAAMLTALTNGAGEKVSLPFVQSEAKPPPRQPPAKKQPHANGAKPAAGAVSREHVMATAAQEEARITEILASRPLRTSEVARLAGTPLTTCAARLARLSARGLVSRDAAERWSASASS